MKHITPEIKARVFALYWGQKIAKAEVSDGDDRMSKIGGIYSIQHFAERGWFVQVKSLSSITDEDAEVILQLHDPTLDFSKVSSSTKNSISIYYESGRFADTYVVYVKELSIDQADYLRSKGYALPYLNYSVSDLVEAGVFKLKEEQK